MSDNYEKIKFMLGSTIDRAVQELLECKEKGALVCGDFNGITLKSDTVTIDGAYKAITGKTKSEFDDIYQ